MVGRKLSGLIALAISAIPAHRGAAEFDNLQLALHAPGRKRQKVYRRKSFGSGKERSELGG